MYKKFSKDTSWHKESKWYNKIVGNQGHFYHQTIILPNVLKLLEIKSSDKILDVGCGQGIFAKQLSKEITYSGIDLAPGLINLAKQTDRNINHTFFLADATKPFPITDKDFTKAIAILSLQNMEKPDLAIKQVSEHVVSGSKFIIVLNHPCFRIPRQSGWGVSENKVQYRYENVYMSFLKIPITMHPGEKTSPVTWSFHYPLSFYSKALQENGFVISGIEEWTSSKESQGKMAKSENKARSEIPLFLTIVALKQ